MNIKQEIKTNLWLYVACFVVASLGILYAHQIKSQFTNLRIWQVENLLWMLVGIPFLFLQTQAGLPNFWEKKISNRHRLLMPLLIGIGFGVLDVLIIKVWMHPEPYQELPPFLQPFPYSIFLYFSGAWEVEVFYRLIPLTIFCLIGTYLQQGKYFQFFFWLGAVLTAIREPLEQMPNAGILFLSYALISGFLMNFLQAIYYKQAGFLASLSVRLGHYLMWHILLGVYVQFVEL
jgi:hypothetical protein